MTEMLPPQDEEAERAALGAMMSGSARALADVARLLAPEDFYSGKHRAVFAAALAVDESGVEVDPVSVARELERRGELSKVGGAPYLHTLYASVPIATNAAHYAELVANKAQLRGLVEAGTRVVHMAHQGADAADVAELVENARNTMDEAASGARRGLEVSESDDLLDEALDAYASPAEPSTPMGWLDLDQLTGGMKPGQLWVPAARPGVGKSVIALNTAINVARSGQGVVFFSLEMSRQEVADRMLANLARVDQKAINNRELSDDDWRRLRAAREKLKGLPLQVCEYESIGVSGIRTVARDLSRTPRGVGLVVVDYLQLLRPADPRAQRQEQVASFSRGLKLLAKELGVPVVAVAQLNRGSEQRTDKRPTMSDLRESGAIEQDSDKVLLLHHDASDEIKRDSEIEVIVAKNRQGPTDSVSLAWSPQYARVDNLGRHLEAA